MRNALNAHLSRPAPAGAGQPFVTLLVLISAIGLTYLPGAFELTLFDRYAIAQGEWWRLLSGHFTHTGSSHLGWDLLAAAIATGYLEKYHRALAISALVSGIVSVNLLLLSPFSNLQFYCGLSGVLFAPLTVIIIQIGVQHRSIIGWLPALTCAGKVTWELCTAQSLLVTSVWPAYPLAHVAGMVGGIVALGWQIGHQQSRLIHAMICFELGRTAGK